MLSILIDANTSEFFSKEQGWNKTEATIADDRDWSRIIYRYNGPIRPEQERIGFNNRSPLVIPLSVPREPEIFT